MRIAYQARPDIFAKEIILPEQLYERVVEVDERVRADGTVEQALDLPAASARDRPAPAATASMRWRSSSCMPGNFRSTRRRSQGFAGRLGFAQVSVSHEVSPLIKLVGRGDTTVVDAYLSPILSRYVEAGGGRAWTWHWRAAAELPLKAESANASPRLMFMMSSGGLTAADLFQGKDAILSGPAGGVVGMVETARLAGFDKVIGFDMGGTSTDVAHYDGDYERAFDTEVAGVRVRAPMMRIHTVAAGGGSILHYEAGRFRVGPDSAGANPGPACYRRGGPLAVTDANVMLGKLQPDFFPAIFGPGQDQPLDAETVRQEFAALAAEIGDGRTPEAVAEGFVTIAVENMANAIKKISVQRGYDVTEYLLNCFGGAGGQHACLVADALGMESVLIHPFSGCSRPTASALSVGLRLAPAGAARSRWRTNSLGAIDGHRDDAAPRRFVAELAAQGIAAGEVACAAGAARPLRRHRHGAAGRFRATARSPTAKRMFEAAHKAQFGFVYDDKPLVVETGRVEGTDSAAAEGRDEADAEIEEQRRKAAEIREDLLRRRLARRRRLPPRSAASPATASPARR